MRSRIVRQGYWYLEMAGHEDATVGDKNKSAGSEGWRVQGTSLTLETLAAVLIPREHLPGFKKSAS
jgi:hypothetical protein